MIIFIKNIYRGNKFFWLIFRVNPFVYATEFRMRHRIRNNAYNGRLLNPNPLSELQYSEWQKVIVAISLIENRSCTRIQFHRAAENLFCRIQKTTRELRFATRESWSNFVEKISEELIIRLSTLKRAFPMFLL